MDVFRYEGNKKLFHEDFMNLVEARRSEEVLSMIRNYHQEYLVDSDGTHLLHLSARFNDNKLISFCIESECKIDVEDTAGTTPMMTAIEHGNFDAASTLLEAQVAVLFEKSYGNSICNPRWEDLRNEEGIRLKLLRLKQHTRRSHLQDVVSKFRVSGWNSSRIGEILAKLSCELDHVVCFHNANVTEAYLQSRPSACYLDSTSWKEVVARFDWRHIRVLICHRPYEKFSLLSGFVHVLVHNLSDYHESTHGSYFLIREITFSGEVFNEVSLEYFERSLMSASHENVAIFLQYGFHSIIKANCGGDVFAGLFSNPNLELASLLKNEKIDVDKRYHEGNNTLLHIATFHGCAKNIQFLLEFGAYPHVFNKERDTPMNLAIRRQNSECVRQLLLGGSNLLLVGHKLIEGLFRMGFCNEDLRKLIVAHFAIMEAGDRENEKFIAKYHTIFFDETLLKFFEECLRQLNELKSCAIHDTKKYRGAILTVFTLLVERPIKIAQFVREDDLKILDELLGREGASWLSYYCDALNKNAKDIVTINYLRDRAAFFTGQFIGIPDSDHLVVQKIVLYLSVKDLVLFQT